MKLPEVVSVTAVDSDRRGPVADVALSLVLFARHKNNYHVGPFLTNATGRVDFTRAECIRAIRSAQAMFVMDYESDLESCLPWLEVKLHPPDQLERMMRQHEQAPDFWERAFQNAAKLFISLRKARNREYESTAIKLSEEEVLANYSINFPLKKRGS